MGAILVHFLILIAEGTGLRDKGAGWPAGKGSLREETAGLLDKGAGWPAGQGSRLEETAGLLDKGAGWPAGQGSRLEKNEKFKNRMPFGGSNVLGGSDAHEREFFFHAL